MNPAIALIALLVGAVAYVQRRSMNPTRPNLPTYVQASPNTPPKFAQPGVTSSPNVSATTPPTNQPSAASSGVPGFAGPQNAPFANNIPGPPLQSAPFQPFAQQNGGYNQPYRSPFRSVFSPSNIRQLTNPFSIPGTPGAPAGSSGGCGCGCNGGPPKPSSCLGAQTPAPYPAPNQPINIPRTFIAQSNPNPMTLAAQIANLTSPDASNFNVYQQSNFSFEEMSGEVPAGPTFLA